MIDIHQDGACVLSGQSEIFFSDKPAEQAAAQAICNECPVRLRCLAFALEDGIEWGVWGGVIFTDGRTYFRRRGRGRPRHGVESASLEVPVEDLRRLVRSA